MCNLKQIKTIKGNMSGVTEQSEEIPGSCSHTSVDVNMPDVGFPSPFFLIL